MDKWEELKLLLKNKIKNFNKDMEGLLPDNEIKAQKLKLIEVLHYMESIEVEEFLRLQKIYEVPDIPTEVGNH